MIKLTNILFEMIVNQPKLSPLAAAKKKIKDYINNGSKGDLDLEYTLITSLPDNLTVEGILNLEGTSITSLPDGLKVGGNLILSYCKELKSLPDNLEVGGNLWLNDTLITSLPDNLTVGGTIDLSYSSITSLPSDLEVIGTLHLRDTPISKKYTVDQIKKMVPGVMRIYI